MEQFGKALRAYRKHRRMTQTELANAVGVAPAYVSQIESSLRMPSLRVARRFAEVLHVELPVLLGTSPERGPCDRMSDSEKLELLHALIRGVEEDLDTRPVREDVESYPGAKGARLQSTPAYVVRSYAFGSLVAAGHLYAHEGEETLFCACGSAWVILEGTQHPLRVGEVFRFDALRPHVVLGAEGAIVVSTAAPPPTAEGLQRLPTAPGGIRVSEWAVGASRGAEVG